MFTWIPIHREAIQKLLEYRDNQDELLATLREMQAKGLKVVSLDDKTEDGQTIPLAEIDPFTFFATFNRGIKSENRQENWSFLKARWSLTAPIPEDFRGLPLFDNRSSRLFPFVWEREKDHIASLWQVAITAANGGIENVDGNLFDRCIDLKCVRIGSLSIGLFWINPKRFLPADSKTTAYGESKGVPVVPKDYQTYRQWIKEVSERLGSDYAQVSHDAHIFATLRTPGGDQPQNGISRKGWRFARWMGPILDALRSLGGAAAANAVLKAVAESSAVKDTSIHEQLASGQTRFYNEAHWARKYLVWEGLLESPERGLWQLTDKGKETHLDEKQAQDIAEKWAKRHKEKEDHSELASPFDVLFKSLQEAEAAFDLLKQALSTLGVSAQTAETDQRIALTLPKGGAEKMRLNFGNWAILTFISPENNARSVQFLCRKDKVPDQAECRPDSGFADLIEGNAFALAYVTPEIIQDGDSDARKEFEKSLGEAARHFEDWNRSPWRDLHRPQLLRMVFDSQERSRLLREGLTPVEAGELALADNERTVTESNAVRYWWLNANPKIWNYDQTPVGEKQAYTSHNEKGNKRQKYRYFQEVKPGDIVVGYVTSPQKEVVALCEITKALHQAENGEEIEFKKVEQFAMPLAYETLHANPDLSVCEPLVNNQGSLFKLTEHEYEIIRSLIDEANIPVTNEIESYDKKKAMKGLFLAESQFDEMLEALKEKKNVVLQGAPGVGKTYVARRLAYALIESNDPQRMEMIQFHQSYSYEDFIQGFRPTSKGHFDLKYGIFYQFCRRAQRDEDKGRPYIFIIDEINRGNLSKIFGELMMLVEADKRGKEHAIPLAYSRDADEKFYIPENLHLVGMMNTADRSLAMVDYALRRRFRFITLRPEFLSETFRTSLEDSGAEPALVNKIIERMTTLNEAIVSDAKNLGPGYQIGHSYFCPRKGIKTDEDWYKRVIQAEIVPLIQEYWFDNDQKVNEQRSALLA